LFSEVLKPPGQQLGAARKGRFVHHRNHGAPRQRSRPVRNAGRIPTCVQSVEIESVRLRLLDDLSDRPVSEPGAP
jgi:hypothetical protein